MEVPAAEEGTCVSEFTKVLKCGISALRKSFSVEWESDNHEYAGVQIGRKQMSYYVTRHQGSDYCNFEYINEESYSKLLAKLALL